jgi:hypothetical protein
MEFDFDTKSGKNVKLTSSYAYERKQYFKDEKNVNYFRNIFENINIDMLQGKMEFLKYRFYFCLV